MDMILDTKAFADDLRRLEQRQIPQAIAWALNDAAKDVLDHIQNRMEVEFDRPTRFTKNAFMVWRATRGRLEATVQERPSVGKRHYLKVQEAGGPRGQTGIEGLLSRNLAYDGILRSVIPTSGQRFGGAKLDSFGNWSTGERNKVLSALRSHRDGAANETSASRARNRRRATYFVPSRGGLAPGVWRRDTADAIPVPVLWFSDKVPVYTARLGFYVGAAKVFGDVIGPRLTQAVNKALATAR